MKRPPYTYRLIIILLILTVVPIGATHIGSIYLGSKNGILLGFCVGIPCVTFACGSFLWMAGEMRMKSEFCNYKKRGFRCHGKVY